MLRRVMSVSCNVVPVEATTEDIKKLLSTRLRVKLKSMKRILKIFGLVFVILVSAGVSTAKEWRGIVPLHSTRADVTRLFGACTESKNNPCSYEFENEKVTFSFSKEVCKTDRNTSTCVTVTRIDVIPKFSMLLTNSPIDYINAEEFVLSRDDWFTRFHTDDEEGIGVLVKDKQVTRIIYLAAAKDARLCPNLYIKPSDLFPQKILAEPTCPNVFIGSPENSIDFKEPITLTASVSGLAWYLQPTFMWSISAGKIIGGQHTPTIKVNIKGVAEGTEIKATVIISGIPKRCDQSNSYTFSVHRNSD